MARYKPQPTFDARRREAHARFPALFPMDGEPRPPLATGGLHLALAAALGWSPKAAWGFVSNWTMRRGYLEAVAAGGARLGLDGRPAGAVSAAERDHARAALARMRPRRAGGRPTCEGRRRTEARRTAGAGEGAAA
jgi:sRNA-binding protein